MNMSKRWLEVAAALLGAALSLRPVQAHHSAAQWDISRRIAITGTAKLVQFRNPHGNLEVTVVDAKGESAVWVVETSAVGLLVRRGWKTDRIKAADKISISGHPHREKAAQIYMREIRLPDGTTYGDPTGQDKALD